MRYELRPLGDWPGQTAHGINSKFSASWDDTRELLGRETEHLGARLVIIQIDAQESDIRLDSMLYARARVGYRGVRVSFESKHGPLTYATDMYQAPSWRSKGMTAHWQHNVRAIALGLEALRTVDRYGISRSGEQYRGWAAIEARPRASHFSTVDEAAEWLGAQSGYLLERVSGQRILQSHEVAKTAYRAAVRQLHPDAGGDPTDWERLDRAARMLGIKS